jgi:hypothetical protein
MASQVQICNQALTKVGEQRITSLADGTKQANVMSAIYDVKRDAELAAQPWTFAIRRAQLPASAVAPSFGWTYAYPLPADYLALVEVGEDYVFYDSDTGALFQVEGTDSGPVILTDQAAPLEVRYIARVTNPGLYPPLFVEALACRLAAESCESLTQNLSKRQAAWDERKQAIREAKRVNAIEQPPRQPPASSWLRALDEQ